MEILNMWIYFIKTFYEICFKTTNASSPSIYALDISLY